MSDFQFIIKPKVEIPEYLIGEVCSKLAYIDERVRNGDINNAGDQVTISSNSALSTKDRAVIETKVQDMIQRLVKEAFKPKTKIVEDHMDREIPYSLDPMEELIRRGEVIQEDHGIYVLGPILASLMDFFEGLFISLAKEFHATSYKFPTLIPAKYLEKVNYFKAFPHALSFATHLRSDLDVIQEFSKNAYCDEHGIDIPMSSYTKFATMLSPAVCYHLYFTLADKQIPNDCLAATAVGNCFRYESNNLISLERLWNFTMREIIFVGTKDYVLENRQSAMKKMEKKLEDIGLQYKVETANDPFFIGEFKQAAFQNAFQLKYEIRASLPFKKSTLAVGSYNYHQDFFGRNLHISLADGTPVHTGCVAFGLERLAYAFLSQYGFDQNLWPHSVVEGLK